MKKIFLMISLCLTCFYSACTQDEIQKPKNIILMIGDGMGYPQIGQAILYRQLIQPKSSPLNLEKLYETADHGMMLTPTVDTIVTDSAASATSMACGIKTANFRIGTDPQGKPCETLLEKAQSLGKSTGLVSNVRLTHATPAAFAAHVPSRYLEEKIAEDILIKNGKINVLLSGGLRYFIPEKKSETEFFSTHEIPGCEKIPENFQQPGKRQDKRNLIEEAIQHGYEFACTKDQLENLKTTSKSQKLLGLFSPSAMPMITERATIDNFPSLSQMTQVALERLSSNPKGFFLMIESGLIDWAAHDNDSGTMLKETLDFDQSIGVVLDFVKKNPDTLLVITADHETGGFGFSYGNPVGLDFALEGPQFGDFEVLKNLADQNKSFSAILDKIVEELNFNKINLDQGADQLMVEIQKNTPFTITRDQAKEILDPKNPSPYLVGHYLFGGKNSERHRLAHTLSPQNFSLWATGSHTANPVPILARELIKQGRQVRLLTRSTSDTSHLKDLNVEYFKGDLQDAASLEEGLQGCEELYHVAAQYTFYNPNPALIYGSNVEGTRNILEAAGRNNLKKIVYTSTVGAVGIPKDGSPGHEETPISLEDCQGHYKRSKFIAEQVAKEMAQGGLPVIIVNPSAPVGVRDAKPTPTGKLIVDFLNGKMPAYLDTGLNLVDVEDVAQGHLLAAEKGKVGERYILGNQNLHLKEILLILSELSGREAPKFQIPYGVAWTAGWFSEKIARMTNTKPAVALEAVQLGKKKMFFTPEKAVRELGLPQTEVRHALQKAIHWYIENGYVEKELGDQIKNHQEQSGIINTLPIKDFD